MPKTTTKAVDLAKLESGVAAVDSQQADTSVVLVKSETTPGTDTLDDGIAELAVTAPAPSTPTVWNDEFTGIGGSYIVVDGKRQPAP